MGVPKKRTSKMRRDRRRAANNNLRSAVQVIKCGKCSEPVLPHRACGACGYYKGRETIPAAQG
ncbi:50S ribosomal protein L32 [Melittangium boletus]|uniref:Large ribosomal subunit protein bL32 n=1 Tax=Melittangium boletus DSM 14713 TaxID=1294270 RepID=A0A250IMK3_9BACT|nr:50S ribosomal protein L32 [Melittangium boletus]ATB32480.1 50S ribosomal protein L32 [Melittangium boletus DSM 14713]